MIFDMALRARDSLTPTSISATANASQLFTLLRTLTRLVFSKEI